MVSDSSADMNAVYSFVENAVNTPVFVHKIKTADVLIGWPVQFM